MSRDRPDTDRPNTDHPKGVDPESDRRFDQVLDELTGIVEQLEQSELPLEESLVAFERGVVLSRQGQGILDQAERRIEVLLSDGKTEMIE